MLTYDGVFFANLHLGCTHVANLDLSMCTVDEDIIALDVTVDNWRVVGMKVD